jgi:hypothetical protein
MPRGGSKKSKCRFRLHEIPDRYESEPPNSGVESNAMSFTVVPIHRLNLRLWNVFLHMLIHPGISANRGVWPMPFSERKTVGRDGEVATH